MESSAQIKQLQRIKIDHKLNASEENAINYAIRYIKQNEGVKHVKRENKNENK